MNWQPLISRWRVEADRRQQQLAAGGGPRAGDQSVRWGFEQAAIISTLRKCAEQAEKSMRRAEQRDRKARAAAEAEFLVEPGK